MRKISILILAVLALTMACEDNADTNDVKIRIANSSAFDYENVIVNTSTGNVDFGDIDAGMTSEYQTFTKAYRYAFVQIEVNGDTLSLQPIDYVGESPLKNGRYTFQLYVSGMPQQYILILNLQVDK